MEDGLGNTPVPARRVVGRARRAQRRATRVAARGRPAPSRTVTIDRAEGPAEDECRESEEGRHNAPTLTLRLRRRRVQWTEDTHDNEHDGKKSSKSCCIFHKQRAFDESSTESDEDNSDRDDDGDGAGAGGDSSSESSSGGQRRLSHSSHVRRKLRELERLEMERELSAKGVSEP